jgi:multiple sugar transport system substrate-binding protein
MYRIKWAHMRQAVTLLVVMVMLGTLLAACGENNTGGTGGTGTSAATATTAPAGGGEAAATATPAAAGGGAEATPSEPTAPEAGTKPAEGTIQVAVVKGDMIITMRKLAEAYMQANQGAKVDVVIEPEGGAFDARIAAGNQPDMFVASFGSQIGKYSAQEFVIPMEDLPGAKDLLGKLSEETVQQLYGHNFYMPIGADVTMLIYNKDLFKQAGLDPNSPPKTWDEFLSYAEKIQALPAAGGNKIYGTVFWNDALAWGGWYWNMLQPMYLNANQKGCQLLNKLGTDIVFDKPECKMADFFAFAQKAQKFAPPTMEKNFFSRTIGMWPQYGYSWEPNLKQAEGKPMVVGEDVGVAPVPVPKEGDTSYSTYGGRALMIFKTTPDRQNRAWEFVKFLMQDAQALEFDKELGYLPTLKSLQGDPYFADPARKPFVDQLKNSILPEQFATAEDVANQVLGVYQQSVVQGQLSPEQAVTTAAEKGRGVLK